MPAVTDEALFTFNFSPNTLTQMALATCVRQSGRSIIREMFYLNETTFIRRFFCTFQSNKEGASMVKETMMGQWLWYSWQHGRFRIQRTRVRIQSPATFIKQLFTVNCY